MLTTAMREAFGYDSFGNAEDLIAEKDKRVIEAGINRASGGVICRCRLPYYSHPPVQGALWLTRTCEGLYKL